MANSNEYMKEYMSRRRAERREKLLMLAGYECCKCSECHEGMTAEQYLEKEILQWNGK